MIDQVTDAHSLGNRFSYPSILRLQNCESALKRTELEAPVSLRDFLEIGAILRNARSLKEWKKHCETQTHIDELFESLTPNKALEDRINEVGRIGRRGAGHRQR